MTEEQQITTVTPKNPFVVRREQAKQEIRLAEKILDQEQESSKSIFGETLALGRFIIAVSPSIISLLWSLVMGNKQRIAIAATGLLVAILANFGVDLPAEVVSLINGGFVFLLGYLIPNPKKEEGK